MTLRTFGELLYDARRRLEWSLADVASRAECNAATIHKYEAGKRPRGDFRTIDKLTGVFSPALARKLPSDEYRAWVDEWVDAAAETTGYPHASIRSLIPDEADAFRPRPSFSAPSEVREWLQAQLDRGNLRSVLNDRHWILDELRRYPIERLSRPEALASADSYAQLASAGRDGLPPDSLDGEVLELYDKARFIVMRPSSRDAEREAAIVSKVALTTGMINSIPLVVESKKADFSPVTLMVREGLSLTEDSWTVSEILRHQAQFQIRDAAQGKVSPLEFRRTLEAARKSLVRDRAHTPDERWRTSQLLNEIEARGILALSRTRSDISDAERLAEQFAEFAPGHPLRRLQHRYLEIILSALHGEKKAERLKRGLILSPELPDYPYQMVRITEVQTLVDNILSLQSGHERYYLN